MKPTGIDRGTNNLIGEVVKERIERDSEQRGMHTKVWLSKESKLDKAGAICYLYAQRQYTIEACCKAIGVSYMTFREWAQPNVTEESMAEGKVRRGFVPEVHAMYIKSKWTEGLDLSQLIRHKYRAHFVMKAHQIANPKPVIKIIKTATGYIIKEKILNNESETRALVFAAMGWRY